MKNQLTSQEIAEYAYEAAAQMTGDDRADFLADPESWKDGIETNHAIADRADGEYAMITTDREWALVRDALIGAIGSLNPPKPRLVEVRNDFHGTSAWVREGVLSQRQLRRLRGKLCGVDDCACSGLVGSRGPQADGVTIQATRAGGLETVSIFQDAWCATYEAETWCRS